MLYKILITSQESLVLIKVRNYGWKSLDIFKRFFCVFSQIKFIVQEDPNVKFSYNVQGVENFSIFSQLTNYTTINICHSIVKLN